VERAGRASKTVRASIVARSVHAALKLPTSGRSRSAVNGRARRPLTRSGRDARTQGTICRSNDDGVVVAAGQEAIRLITVQRAGKTRVAGGGSREGEAGAVGRRL